MTEHQYGNRVMEGAHPAGVIHPGEGSDGFYLTRSGVLKSLASLN